MKVRMKLYGCPLGYYVKAKPKKLKRVKVKEPGFYAHGTRIKQSSILKNKYLSRKEREALLDMCHGVKVKKVRKVRKSKQWTRPVAKYYVDGTIYCDGSIWETSEFYRV